MYAAASPSVYGTYFALRAPHNNYVCCSRIVNWARFELVMASFNLFRNFSMNSPKPMITISSFFSLPFLTLRLQLLCRNCKHEKMKKLIWMDNNLNSCRLRIIIVVDNFRSNSWHQLATYIHLLMRECSLFTSGLTYAKRVQVFFLLEDCIQQTTIYLPIDKAHRVQSFVYQRTNSILWSNRLFYCMMSDVNLFEQSNHIKIEQIIIYIN